MPDPLVIHFVSGVTPRKWERIWRERRPRDRLELVPTSQVSALDALRDGSANMAFVRDIVADDSRFAIPLYREVPVVVAPRDSLIASADDLKLADLDDETVLDVDLTNGNGLDATELVAANVGVAIMPQSVARAHSRRDLVARPLNHAPDTGISLVWQRKKVHPLCDVFIGIVRGRTVNSSR